MECLQEGFDTAQKNYETQTDGLLNIFENVTCNSRFCFDKIDELRLKFNENPTEAINLALMELKEDYSSQLNQLESDKSQLRDYLGTLEIERNQLKLDIETVETEKKHLNSTIEGLEFNLNELRETNESLEHQLNVSWYSYRLR